MHTYTCACVCVCRSHCCSKCVHNTKKNESGTTATGGFLLTELCLSLTKRNKKGNMQLLHSRQLAAATAAAAATPHRCFHSQHRTPVLPQVHVADQLPPQRVHVGYWMHRNQIVKHTPHPLEIEMGYLLERELQRYSRHESTESATAFFASRGQSLDLLNRTDANQIKGNFFGLELYQDAMKVVLQRYTPERRVTAADAWDPATLDDQPPPRHTLHRKLDDFLYLIVQDKETGKWTVPHTARKDNESLRMTADRALSSHNADGLEAFFWSNAPQATVLLQEENTRLFIYAATYLSGRPQFELFEPTPKDHAWVTRQELQQYSDSFISKELLKALVDISADSTFECN
jgi:large subunit ribosomal protein L46